MPSDIRDGSVTQATLAAITLAGLIGTASTADTITVCLDGTCDFASVDEAILASGPADRIEIGPGTYPLTMSQDFTDRATEVVGTMGTDGPATELVLSTSVDWYNIPEGEFTIQALKISGAIDGIPEHQFELSDWGARPTIWLIDCTLFGVRGKAYNENGAIRMVRCVIDSCRGEHGPDPVASFFRTGDIVMIDTIVRNCLFEGDNNYFIGLPTTTATRLDLLNCRFDDNITSRQGLIRAWGEPAHVWIDRCVFNNNRPSGGGDSPLATSALSILQAQTLQVTSCEFRDARPECDSDLAPASVAVKIYAGSDILISDCDFEGNGQAIGLAIDPWYEYYGRISLTVASSRFIDNHIDPICATFDGSACPYGGAFGGAYVDPFHSDLPGNAFPAEDVVFTDCSFCGNGDTQLSGAWTDGGGNCISYECIDVDGDGIFDPCRSDGRPPDLHVPGDVPDLAAALAQAIPGQSILLAPGDHELRGLTTITTPDLTIRAETAIEGAPHTARMVFVEDGDVGLRVLSNGGEAVRFEHLDIVLPSTRGSEAPACHGPPPAPAEGMIIAQIASLGFRSCRLIANSDSAVLNAFYADIWFEDCELIGSDSSGGSPSMLVAGGSLSIERSLLDSIHVRVDDAHMTGARCRFESVGGARGALEVWESEATLDRCEFIDCAGTAAGGLYVSSGVLSCSNCWFENTQSASSSGGAVTLRGASTAEISSSTFCNNTPDDVYINSASTWTDLGDNAFGADGCARAAGDLDGDGCVGGGDLGLLFQQWSVTSPTHADLDRDGVVGGGDLGVIFTNWGRCF